VLNPTLFRGDVKLLVHYPAKPYPEIRTQGSVALESFPFYRKTNQHVDGVAKLMCVTCLMSDG